MNTENKLPEEEVKIHQPEFVILNGDEEEKTGEQSKQGEYIDLLNKLNRKKFSWGLRLITLMAAVFVAIACVFAFVLALVSGFLTLITFMMNPEIKATMVRCWRGLRKLLVIFIGLIIGVFSPSLGFGLIILYLMLHKENLRKTFFFKQIFPS